MSVRPRVLLFDLDGTLVSTGGAGRRAMIAAMVEVFDAADAFEGFNFAGMTDRSIVRAGITKARGAATDADIDRVLDAYLPRQDGRVGDCQGWWAVEYQRVGVSLQFNDQFSHAMRAKQF